MKLLEAYIYFKLGLDYARSIPKISHLANLLKCLSAGNTQTHVHSFSPISTVIFVNRKCNLSCPYCYILGELNHEEAKEYDLQPSELKAILDHPLVRNSIRIGFTGGEPFLNRNIFEMIEIVKARKHLLSIVTNALPLLREDVLKELIRTRPNIVSISMYEQNEDKIGPVIAELVGHNIFVKIHKVLEADRLRQIVDHTVDRALDWRVRNILFLNYYPSDGEFQKVIFDDNQEYGEIVRKVSKDYAYKLIIKWPGELHRDKSRRKCKMPFQTIQVDNKGNISPCCFEIPRGNEYGNLFNTKRGCDVFNSEFYLNLRNSLLDSGQPLNRICRNCYLLHENFYGL